MGVPWLTRENVASHLQVRFVVLSLFLVTKRMVFSIKDCCRVNFAEVSALPKQVAERKRGKTGTWYDEALGYLN